MADSIDSRRVCALGNSTKLAAAVGSPWRGDSITCWLLKPALRRSAAEAEGPAGLTVALCAFDSCSACTQGRPPTA